MKKNYLILSALILVLLFFVWYIPNRKELRNTDSSATTESQNKITATPTSIDQKYNEETDVYSIKVVYPEFQNLPAGLQNNINSLIRSQALSEVDEFKRNLAEGIHDLPDVKSEFQTQYKINSISKNEVSVEFENFSYVEGAAHPYSYQTVFNYDFKNTKMITLADFFQANSDYLVSLGAIAKEDIKTSLGDAYIEEMADEGLQPNQENFKNFVFDENKITLIFNLYQVAAYVAGTQRVDIPYEKVNNILNPAGPISLFK